MRPTVIFLILATTVVAAETPSPPVQPLESISTAARAFVDSRGLRLGSRQTVEIGPLDPRLRYSPCPQPLAVAFAPGGSTPPRLTVEVRCPVAPAWKLYVPVKIAAFDHAIVATKALERGHVLTAADVSVTDTPIRDLPPGYLDTPARIEGLRLARPVAAGTVMTASLLDIEPLVRSGDHVTVLAQVNGVAIRTQAIALGSAGANQRVKLRNLSSGRPVEGIVRDKDLVEIAVY